MSLKDTFPLKSTSYTLNITSETRTNYKEKILATQICNTLKEYNVSGCNKEQEKKKTMKECPEGDITTKGSPPPLERKNAI